jgi:hypothetical protein
LENTVDLDGIVSQEAIGMIDKQEKEDAFLYDVKYNIESKSIFLKNRAILLSID